MHGTKMIRGRGFRSRISFDKAVESILSLLEPLPQENVGFHESVGRVLGEDVRAEVNVPPFDRAAVDGYAVLASDTFGATQSNPKKLKIVGHVRVGRSPFCRIKKGETIRVDTGAPIPKGADSVVMLENVVEERKCIYVLSPVTPGKNVSARGEDVRAGEIVLRRGRILMPHDVGLLGAMQCLRVCVYRRPQVSIISTGDELADPSAKRASASVIDSNSYSLAAAVEECGGVPYRVGIVPDDPKVLKERLARALRRDVVIISGGSAAGQKDMVPEVVGEMGNIIFHGVSMRPGGPSAFGIIGKKPVFCLAGFPAGALVAFDMLVRPALRKMQGLPANRGYPKIRARLSDKVASMLGRLDVVRVRVEKKGKEFLACPIRITGSSLLTSMTKADGFVVVPESIEGLEKGDEVDVELYGVS